MITTPFIKVVNFPISCLFSHLNIYVSRVASSLWFLNITAPIHNIAYSRSLSTSIEIRILTATSLSIYFYAAYSTPNSRKLSGDRCGIPAAPSNIALATSAQSHLIH